MTAADENTIVTCGAVVIAVTTLRDMLPPSRGGVGKEGVRPYSKGGPDEAAGFNARHLLGGMAATTLLLLLGEPAPELAKAFAVMTATIAFLFGGANILESFFIDSEKGRTQ